MRRVGLGGGRASSFVTKGGVGGGEGGDTTARPGRACFACFQPPLATGDSDISDAVGGLRTGLTPIGA